MVMQSLEGLFGINIPKAYGGKEVSLLELVDVFISLAYDSLSAAAILGSHVRVAYYIKKFGTERQRERLYDMAAGKVIAAHAHTEREPTIAIRSNSRFTINGHKPLVTNARGTNLIAVTSNNHAETFLIDVPTDGLHIEDEVPRLALKDVSLCPVRLTDCLVSEDSLLGGEEGRGLEYLHSSLGYGIVNYAARAVGIAKSLVDELIANADKTSVSILATLDGYVKAAESLTREAAKRLERDDTDTELALHAKWYSAEVASLVASKVHELIAYRADPLSLEQKLIDAQTLKIVGMRGEQVKERIGFNLLQRTNK